MWYHWNTLCRHTHTDIFINQRIECYLDNTLNLRPLATHKMAIVSWPRILCRHFTLCINVNMWYIRINAWAARPARPTKPCNEELILTSVIIKECSIRTTAVTSVQPLGDLPQRGSVLYTSCSALTQLLGRQELLLLQLLVYYYYYYTRSAVSFPGQDRHCDSWLHTSA